MKVLTYEHVKCDLCGSDQFGHILDGVDWDYGLTDELRLAQCRGCGLIQLNPRPTIDCASAIYPQDYGFHEAPRRRRLPGRMVYWAANVFVRQPKRRPYTLLDGTTPGSILDVGCATGASVYPHGISGSLVDLRDKGWEVHGCDISESAVGYGRTMGLDIRLGTIAQQSFDACGFDVVRFNHVLEHSWSPMADLTASCRFLRPGGRLLISGPNIQSGAYALFGRYWSGLDLPRHLYHFTPTILKRYCAELRLMIVEEHFHSFEGDFTHSLKHFLHSAEIAGRNIACNESEETAFGESDLRKSIMPLIKHLDHARLGDCYTLIAAKPQH